MNDDHVSKFTCKECGGHNLTVTHVWNIVAGANSERWQEWGPLADNHHWHYDFREEVDDDLENEVQKSDIGEIGEDESAAELKEYEIYSTGNGQENDEFFVNCATCDREIEFGWSKPDRRGLILPVEFLDFVPSESWPDQKYKAIWQQREWLQREAAGDEQGSAT